MWSSNLIAVNTNSSGDIAAILTGGDALIEGGACVDVGSASDAEYAVHHGWTHDVRVMVFFA